MGVNHSRRLSTVDIIASALVLSVSFGAALSIPAEAQRIAAAPGTVSSTAESAFAKRVTVHATNEPVRSVIDRIAHQAGLKASYDAALVPPSARVTVQLEQVPVDQAFRRALQGMPLIAQIQVSGNVLILPAPTAYADGVIVGKIVNEKTKAPVRGATVLLDEQTTGVVTGENGEFRISAAAGEHQLHIRALGMVKQSRRVVVADGQTVTVEVVLAPSASVLDEVVVTGTVVATERKAIPNAITVVTAEEIERRGITRIDDLFRGVVPGVLALDIGTGRYAGHGVGQTYDVADQMVASSIVSRGASSASSAYASTTPLKTYIDGVELLDPSYLGTIDPRNIEKVEVITGPQAATIYGSGAMGGVLQIFTKKGAGSGKIDYSARLQYGILQSNMSSGKTPQHRQGISVSGTNGPGFTYALTASHDYTGEWQPDLFSRQYSGSIGATYQQGAVTVTGNVLLSGGINGTSGANDVRNSPMDRLLKQTGVKVVIPINQYTSGRVSRSSSQTSSLNIDYRVSQMWQHHIVAGRSQNTFALDPQAPVYSQAYDTLYRRTEASGARTTLSYNTTLQAGVGHLMSMLTAGFTGSFGDRTQLTGCFASGLATSFIPCNTGYYNGDLLVSKPVVDKSWGGFGTMQTGFYEQLYLTIGVRGERNPSYGREHKVDWTPRYGLAYSFDVNELAVKLRTAYGKATRAPTPDMRDARWGFCSSCEVSRYISQFENPKLTPEYSSGPEYGVELYYGNRGSLSVSHYRQRITDLIQRVAMDSVGYLHPAGIIIWNRQYQYLNTAVIDQKGWELTGSSTFGPFSVQGTYSWNDSRIRESRLSNALAGTSFYDIPTHTGNMTFSYALRQTRVLLSTNYIGSAPNSPFSTCCDANATGTYRIKMYLPRYANQISIPKPSYTKTDLTMSQRITSRIEMSLSMQNLTNNFDSDATEGGWPSLGRQTVLGVTIRGVR